MAVAVILVTCVPSYSDTDINDIMKMSYNANQGKDTQAIISMDLLDSENNKKTCELSMWRLQADTVTKTLILFLSPDKVQGMAFLSWQYEDKEDRQWLYLPGFDQVSQVSGSMQSYSFAGDFALCDIAPPHPDEFVHRLLGKENMNGHDCYIIESIHKTYFDAPGYRHKRKFLYSKTVSWIGQDNHLMMKADAFDQKGKEYKQFEVLEITKKDGIWTIVKMAMKDLKKNHQTILTINEIRYEAGLKDSLFNMEQLKGAGQSVISLSGETQ